MFALVVRRAGLVLLWVVGSLVGSITLGAAPHAAKAPQVTTAAASAGVVAATVAVPVSVDQAVALVERQAQQLARGRHCWTPGTHLQQIPRTVIVVRVGGFDAQTISLDEAIARGRDDTRVNDVQVLRACR